jgi:hypothetical protein
MDWVVDLFNMILSGFQAVVDFFSTDVYEIFRQFGEFLFSFVEMCFNEVLSFCCFVMSELLGALFGAINFSGPIESAWQSLTSEAREALVFFRIPTVMVIYFSALSIRLIRLLIPFI